MTYFRILIKSCGELIKNSICSLFKIILSLVLYNQCQLKLRNIQEKSLGMSPSRKIFYWHWGESLTQWNFPVGCNIFLTYWNIKTFFLFVKKFMEINIFDRHHIGVNSRRSKNVASTKRVELLCKFQHFFSACSTSITSTLWVATNFLPSFWNCCSTFIT